MREDLLEAAEKMVQDRGLDAVSFQQLADAVGLSKASVFHHFPNKQSLACALVDRCQTKYGAQYAALIDAALSAPEKLRAIAAVFEQGLKTDRLCLLGSIGHGVGSQPEPVREALRVAVGGAIERYARVFEQGEQEKSLRFEGKPADAAAALLALLEGLQVLARARGDHALFTRSASVFIESLVVS